jgi:lysozyme
VVISRAGIELIESFEDYRAGPYLDAAGDPTIGYGTRTYPNNVAVTMEDAPISKLEAAIYLQSSLNKICLWINQNITCTLNQNQFDALCSFFYNVGWRGFINSNPNTWHVLSSCNLSQFAQDMLKFCHVNGEVCPGLVSRREKEQALFLTPMI